MRKSTFYTFFLLFAALLLVHQIPGAFADQCYMSGSDRVLVDMGLGGDLQSFPHFTADLDPNNNLQISGQGVVPSCFPLDGMLFNLTRDDDNTQTDLRGITSTFEGQAIKVKGADGYNHLDFYDFGLGRGTADLVGSRVEVNIGGILFDTFLVPYTDPSTGQHYVKITNPIQLIGSNPIAGPSLYLTDGVTCGPRMVANAVYIPVNSDWSLDFKCGARTFGPVLYSGGPGIPALSNLGLLLFSVGIFGAGIWVMRKARFGNTLAGL
jgi:hypothetical protein